MLLITLLLTIFSTNLWAKSLGVETHLKKMQLHFSDESLTLKGHQLDLSMQKKSCNEHIIKKFQLDLERALSRQTKNKSPFPLAVKYTWKEETYYESPRTDFGQYLLRLPQTLQKLKLEEKYNCDKK
jgi:hypothetical protein